MILRTREVRKKILGPDDLRSSPSSVHIASLLLIWAPDLSPQTPQTLSLCPTIQFPEHPTLHGFDYSFLPVRHSASQGS